MSKPKAWLINLAILLCAVTSVSGLVSATPLIEDRCVVCGNSVCEYDGSSIDKMTVVQWLYRNTSTVHFGCAKDYNVDTNALPTK